MNYHRIVVILIGLLLVGEISAETSSSHQFHHPQAFLDKIKGRKDAGKLIYQQFCELCHAMKPLVNVAAPRIGVNTDWDWRLKQGMNAMIERINLGVRAMPPRGGCFECSDEQLKEAVEYMLPKKSQERK